MKKSIALLFSLVAIALSTMAFKCDESRPANTTALDEQAETEKNQQVLFANQPPPKLTWSMERESLTKRSLLQNDRAVFFYMYIFIEGVSEPIGYYQVNKVSSVNSQLTNTEQIISGTSSSNNLPSTAAVTIPSPSEDGSYGSNGDAVFGFTPEDIYIESNMKYICSTVPLHFKTAVAKIAVMDLKTEQDLKILMNRINKQKSDIANH